MSFVNPIGVGAVPRVVLQPTGVGSGLAPCRRFNPFGAGLTGSDPGGRGIVYSELPGLRDILRVVPELLFSELFLQEAERA